MPEYPLAELPLACRLEGQSAADLASFAALSRDMRAYPEAVHLRVGGGTAAWFSPGNILNGACGLGMGREVEQEEIAALVAFFAERGEPARIDVCPQANRSLLRWLAEARFVATGFEMVLYQPLPASATRTLSAEVTVRLAESPEDRALWAELEARGFGEDDPSPEHLHLSRAISLRTDALYFLGCLEGDPVGTGILRIADGLAMLNGDSTLPRARNRGVQTALLAERIAFATRAGCDLCMIEAAPGGSSFRNQQRAGFRVAYNRVTFELPAGK